MFLMQVLYRHNRYLLTLSNQKLFSNFVNMTEDKEFTKEEAAELDRFEEEHPYQEIPEEEIRIPKRPEKITDTKHDVLFLVLFCIAMVIFLIIIFVFK